MAPAGSFTTVGDIDMRYTIVDGSNEVKVEIRALNSGQFWVRIGDQEPQMVDALVDGQLVHYVASGKSNAVTVARNQSATLTHVDGKSRSLDLLDSHSARRRSRRQRSGSGGGDLTIKSPMPGRIVKVLVEPGQSVQPGDGVIIVEAMKMENELRAECAGIVDQVHVQSDDRVDGNATLISLRPAEGTES